MSEIHLEILDKQRKEVFKKLGEFAPAYLAGGTALSLQIYHRKSFDFDIFVDNPLTKTLIKKCQTLFGKNIDIIRESSDQISMITPNNIKLDFVYYWYQQLQPLIETSSISLASIEDIAADKSASLGRRAVWRDYVDLFYILKHNYLSLEKLIKLAEKKFGSEFNQILFLEQLAYFEDLEITEIEFVDKKYSDEENKTFLKNTVEKYLAENPIVET